MKSYKEICNEYKEFRQTKTDKPDKIKGKSKRDRPFTIEYRLIENIFENGKKIPGPWRKHKDYRTLNEAQDALDNLNRKFNIYRLKPND